MVSYRTGLSRARGLGSAKHGAGHWVTERVTSIALAPLTLWAVYSALVLALADFTGAALWVSHPVNAVLLCLLIGTAFLHMHAGMRVIIEDYFHTKLNKALLLLLNLFVCVGGAVLAIFCVIKVAVSVAGAPV